MTFSFGRKLGSFLSDFTPEAFKSSLGPLEASQTQSVVSEQLGRAPDSPVLRSFGGGLTAITPQNSNYEVAAPAPGWVADLQVRPDVRFRPTIGEYWNTPLGDTQLTRVDHLRRIGSALRDPEDGAAPFSVSLPDLSLPSQRSGPSQGGGVGGIGGAGRRRSARGWS